MMGNQTTGRLGWVDLKTPSDTTRTFYGFVSGKGHIAFQQRHRSRNVTSRYGSEDRCIVSALPTLL